MCAGGHGAPPSRLSSLPAAWLPSGAALLGPRLHRSQGTGGAQARVETELAAAGSAFAPPKLKAAVATASPPGTDTGAAKPPPPSITRKIVEPAPAEARPATSARAVGGRAGLSHPAGTAPGVATGPFTVSIAYASPDLQALAYSTTDALTHSGVTANIRGLEGATTTSDALVVLTAGPPAAWYCDDAGGSASLAGALAGILPGGSTAGDDGAPPIGCGQLGGGRTATAVVAVPAQAPAPEFPANLAKGIGLYLSRNGAAQRQAAASARLVWPATGPITSFYGPSHPLGIDIGESTGNIVAATTGRIAFAGGNPCCSYGLYVVIDSPAGIRTVYGHLSAFAVKTGDKVTQGQVIGKAGSTGNSTGPHLHFEVIDNGIRRNPLTYLSQR